MRLTSAARFAFALLLLAAMLALASCGDDSSDESNGSADSGETDSGEAAAPAPPPDDAVDLTAETAVTVAVGDNKYTERAIIVAPGTEVTWVNEGLNRHDVVASEPGSFEDIPIEDLDDGGSASRTFEEPGDYAYYCSIHGSPANGQRGWITVAPAA